MHRITLTILFVFSPITWADDSSWKTREAEVVGELNQSFDKFKLKSEKEKFAKNQKAWTDFSKKNCEELYDGFKDGTAYNSMLQECFNRSIKSRFTELRAVYFQTWPKSVNDKIDRWLK